MADVLRASEPLARLAERLRESNRRFECIRALLPSAWAAEAKPGPVDPLGWTVLAANAGVAAKLRQLVPLLEAELARHGFAGLPVRVKVQAPQS